jgi:hypothetical protein
MIPFRKDRVASGGREKSLAASENASGLACVRRSPFLCLTRDVPRVGIVISPLTFEARLAHLTFTT